MVDISGRALPRAAGYVPAARRAAAARVRGAGQEELPAGWLRDRMCIGEVAVPSDPLRSGLGVSVYAEVIAATSGWLRDRMCIGEVAVPSDPLRDRRRVGVRTR